MIVESSIYFFNLVNFYFIYFEGLLLVKYKYILLYLTGELTVILKSPCRKRDADVENGLVDRGRREGWMN